MSRRDAGWRLEPHVCRVCFSRIASRVIEGDAEDRREYVCTGCGLEAAGHRASVLCACGTKVKKGKTSYADAGLRCHENRARSPEFPALYVASVNGAQPDC